MDTQEIQKSVPDRPEHAISHRRVRGGGGWFKVLVDLELDKGRTKNPGHIMSNR